MTSASVCRDSWRGPRSPTPGTSITSFAGELAQRAAGADLDVLGVLRRRAQRHRDVVGDLVARDGNHRGMADGTVFKNGEISRPPADIQECDSDFLLFLIEHRIT